MHDVLDRNLNATPQWRARPGRSSIPMNRWGEDHWGLLAYLDHCAAERQGGIEWHKVRLSRRNWPMLWAARDPYATVPGEDAADAHGLKLAAPVETLRGYCEADALMDLVEHGLVVIEMPPVSITGASYLRPDGHALNRPSPDEPVTGEVEQALMPWARFTLTPQGQTLADAVWRHSLDGNALAEFTPGLEGSR